MDAGLWQPETVSFGRFTRLGDDFQGHLGRLAKDARGIALSGLYASPPGIILAWWRCAFWGVQGLFRINVSQVDSRTQEESNYSITALFGIYR